MFKSPVLDLKRLRHPGIEQAAVVLVIVASETLGRQFIAYLKEPETVRILQSYGFAVPQTTR